MNLPNKLSILRIMLIPFMMFFYLFEGLSCGIYIALALFIVASITDFLDGYIARKYNMVTDMGKFLDSIADKMLTGSAFFLIACDGTIPAPFGVIVITIIICREYMISALRQIAATKQVIIAADKWGKYKTVSQIFAISILMLFAATDIALIGIIGWCVLGISVLLAIISGINYLIKNKNVFNNK